MDTISYLCSMCCVIIGSFIGHMVYDIYKTHKSHKGDEKRKIGKDVKS